MPGGNERGLHTTQKPVALFEYLILTYTNETDIVLDNCMGSGTTAIAAINTKRNYVGIEKEQKYFDNAKEAEDYFKQNQTRNFVVFDPSTVKILEENGKPLSRKELIEKQIKDIK